MWCSTLCLDGEVVSIHAKHVGIKGNMWENKVKDYLRGVIDSVNPEFAPFDSKNECNRTEHVFSSLPEVSIGTVAL